MNKISESPCAWQARLWNIVGCGKYVLTPSYNISNIVKFELWILFLTLKVGVESRNRAQTWPKLAITSLTPTSELIYVETQEKIRKKIRGMFLSIAITVVYPLFCYVRNRKSYKINGKLRNKGRTLLMKSKIKLNLYDMPIDHLLSMEKHPNFAWAESEG